MLSLDGSIVRHRSFWIREIELDIFIELLLGLTEDLWKFLELDGFCGFSMIIVYKYMEVEKEGVRVLGC